MALEILKYPDPKLKRKSTDVAQFGKKLHELLDEMAVTMYSAEGVGLAAPQVGETVRAFVIDIGPTEPEKQKLYEFVNPKISGGMGSIAYEEGCLSVPGITAEVKRREVITVDFFDRHGKPQKMVAEGLLAVAIQHENDHLDGILFVEKLSPLKRRMIRKQLEKAVTL